MCGLCDLLLRLFELRDRLLSGEGVLSRHSGDGRYFLELYLSGLLGDGVLRSYLSRDFSLAYLSGLYGEGVRRSYLSRDFSLESSLLDLSLWGDFLSLRYLLVCGEGVRRPLLLLGASLFDDLFVLDEDRCLRLWLLSSYLSSFLWCLWCLWSCDVDGESCLRLVLVSSGVSSLRLCLCLLWVCGGVRCFLLWWAGGSSLDLLAFMSFDVVFDLMVIFLTGEGSGDGSSSSDVVECSVEMVISAGPASWMNLQLLPLVHFPSR